MIVWGFLGFCLLYLLNPGQYREDWKSLVGQLEAKEVYMVSSFYDPIKYYNHEIEVKDIRGEIEAKEIVVIPYGEEIHGVKHEEILKAKAYELKEEKVFRGLELERWERGVELSL